MSEFPKNANFAIYIDFEPGEENPERIFQAIDQAIRLFRELDQILCKTIDLKIEPKMVLEEIESGSLKVWIRIVLECVDDDALKNMNWRPLLGKFLVKAKYAIIDWTKQGHEATADVNSIGRKISKLAEKTGVSKLPRYRKIDSSDLSKIPVIMDRIKALPPKSASMKYLTNDKEIDVKPIVDVAPAEVMKVAPERVMNPALVEVPELLTDSTAQTKNRNLDFVIKRPVYFGHSKWDFLLDNKTVSAPIEDSGWLDKFQSREVDLRPGDALRCSVRIETKYGCDEQILSEKYFIVSVDEVIN